MICDVNWNCKLKQNYKHGSLWGMVNNCNLLVFILCKSVYNEKLVPYNFIQKNLIKQADMIKAHFTQITSWKKKILKVLSSKDIRRNIDSKMTTPANLSKSQTYRLLKKKNLEIVAGHFFHNYKFREHFKCCVSPT